MKKSLIVLIMAIVVVIVIGGIILTRNNDEENILQTENKIQEEIDTTLENNNEINLDEDEQEDYNIKPKDTLTFSVNGEKYTLPVKFSDMKNITIESVNNDLKVLQPNEDTYAYISFNNSTHSNFMGNKNTYEVKIKNLTDSSKDIKECTILRFSTGTYESTVDMDEFEFVQNIIVGKSTVNDVIKAYGIKDYDGSGFIEIKNYDTLEKLELTFTSNGILNRAETGVMVNLYK